MWNFHWCLTAAQRVGAMVPRMNRVLETARAQGSLVIWNPSDVVTAYAGTPQYERADAADVRPAPQNKDTVNVRFTTGAGACMCGPGHTCRVNYGWDAMAPALKIAAGDLFSASTDEINTLLRERGIENIVYMGVHTNMCVFGKPGALAPMKRAGFKVFLARDLNDAFTRYDPQRAFTPDTGTGIINQNLADGGVTVLNFGELQRDAGLWAKHLGADAAGAPVDYVRFAPWGKPDRPYVFDNELTVTLTQPWLDGAEIRYTTDGTEPTPASPLYTAPLKLRDTTRLRATAFRDAKPVSLPSDAFYAKLPPAPPAPDVYLDDLDYAANRYLDRVKNCFWYPRKKANYDGKPLWIRDDRYAHGLGFRAPASVRYALKPEYKRFVALAGVDDNLRRRENGRALAMHSSVVFHVFIDGRPVAASPVQRIGQPAWRFDVPIPAGARVLSIAVTDAGTPHPLDLGNFVNAGFITK